MSGILAGIRVLDLSRFIAAPFCTMLLADMGAEVIKIEKPKTGDISRQFKPYKNGETLYFTAFNRNKKGITIDLRSQDGKELLKGLIKKSDVLVQNFRPGVMDAMGFGYDEVKKVNPRLIMASISGFGQTGPYRERAGMDWVDTGDRRPDERNGYAGKRAFVIRNGDCRSSDGVVHRVCHRTCAA